MKFGEPPCSNGSVSLPLRRFEQCQKDGSQGALVTQKSRSWTSILLQNPTRSGFSAVFAKNLR